jgi:GT2 family glycosyltransferase
MISVVIPHWPFDETIDAKLKACVESMEGHGELILVVNEGTGFAKAVNQGLRLAKGDFIVVMNNDMVWTAGSVRELCDPEAVTSPKVNDREQSFWGCCFCLPRWVYEKIGGLDEQFGTGFYEDDDYIMRLKQAPIPTRCVTSCNIEGEGGATMKRFDVPALMKKNKALYDEKWSA